MIQFLWLEGMEMSEIYGRMQVNLMAISVSQRMESQEDRQVVMVMHVLYCHQL